MPELTPITLNPPLNVTVVRDQAGLDKLKDFFQREKMIGWDIETNPLRDYFYRRTRTWQFGNTHEQYVIDLRAFCGDDAEALFQAQGYYGLNIPESFKPVLEVVRPVVCSNEWLKVGVNLGFEYQNTYWQFGLRTFNFYDCAMAERAIWAGAFYGIMKKYSFFSMEEMMARYFLVQIDKTLQESFDLNCTLTPEQFAYAALDTRFPLAIRTVQMYILAGETPETLNKKGMTGAAKLLARINPIVLGDDLREIAKIENDAIGAFEDMHVHGERLDRPRWLSRIARKHDDLQSVLSDELDPIFIPLVGNKRDLITEEQIEAAKATWKAFNAVPEEETRLKGTWRLITKRNPDDLPAFEAEHTVVVTKKTKNGPREDRILKLEDARKQEKERLKDIASELGKRQTKIRNLAAKCQGDALINYKSRAQLLNVLKGMKGLARLTDTEDETFEAYESKVSGQSRAVLSGLRKFSKLSKEIGTYGVAWATQWTTKPCKKEGWLHPGDGRLHCIFNQYDAETGRSTSEKPNGQNLPKDKEVRSCFIVDDPDESIRISDCCESDTTEREWFEDNAHGRCRYSEYLCSACGKNCETHAEEYVMVTADMSGAELRILAERACDPVWIGAFNRGEDVHSVCTELMYPEKWPNLTLYSKLRPTGWTLQDSETEVVSTVIENGKEKKLGPCAYYAFKPDGTQAKQKCKCPEHNELRDGTKPVNFGLPYGISDRGLAPQIHKSIEETRELMAKHKAKFPKIWSYIDKAGLLAKTSKKAFDMYGRRRLFPEPTWEDAKFKAKDDREESLQFEEEEQIVNIANFTQIHGRAPKGKLKEIDSELYTLTHRMPSTKEIANAFKAMFGSMERQGKNHEIQGTNATIAKLAMGCGYCPAGKPYLWHTLPQYKAKLIKFVHDELVVQCPKRFGKIVAGLIGDAFKRAAAEKMTQVAMEFDYNIATYWKK